MDRERITSEALQDAVLLQVIEWKEFDSPHQRINAIIAGKKPKCLLQQVSVIERVTLESKRKYLLLQASKNFRQRICH